MYIACTYIYVLYIRKGLDYQEGSLIIEGILYISLRVIVVLYQLTKEEYRILRLKGTERAFTGEYDKFFAPKGYFVCRGCGNPLYSMKAKYNSGCGWPAFDMCYKDSIKTEIDKSHGMIRIEIMCNKCGGHLGHVFNDGHSKRKKTGKKETKQRHCVNSVSVKYIKKDPPKNLKENWLTLDDDVYQDADNCIVM